ncbi:hypothetical protein [Streptomyces sp. NPDC058268]|uniref:hypothetical protein n=1 Tax=Streptomyces sp. NPDC058268 TaxID=3346413 RepID=UPI0036EAC125
MSGVTLQVDGRQTHQTSGSKPAPGDAREIVGHRLRDRRVHGPHTAPLLDSFTDGPEPWLAVSYVPGPAALSAALYQHGPATEPSRTCGSPASTKVTTVNKEPENGVLRAYVAYAWPTCPT